MNKKVLIPVVLGAYLCFSPISVKASDYYKWNMQAIGDKNKVWTVKFSKKLDNDINNLEKKIYVKDDNGSNLKCKIKIKPDGKTVELLPPAVGYNKNKKYYIYIDKSISSYRKENLENDVKMDFYVDKKIEFKDSNLEQAIRDQIGKFSGDILLNDITKIKTLNCENKNIKNLDGLQYLTNLKALYLNDNNIEDISKVSNLTSLKYLNIKNNKIKNIKALKNLDDLETLYLSGNDIKDYDPINYYYYDIKDKDFSLYDNVKIYFEDKNLENEVRKAAIEGNRSKDRPVGDLYNLSYTDVKGIRSLDIHNKNIKSLKGIEYLENLRELNLSNNEINNIDSLRKLSKLNKLDLSQNNINSIYPIKSLSKLEYLNLSNNNIMDISAIKNLNKIKHLDLRHNSIYYIDALSNKKTLNHLFISNNNIKEFNPLYNLANLKSLYLLQNPCSRYDYVKDYYKNLTSKDFIFNMRVIFKDKDLEQIIRKQCNLNQDIIYINDVSSIKSLNLKNAHIHKIDGLECFKNLEKLDLSGTDISDITPLSSLSKLKEVDLHDTKINEINSLKYSKEIKKLNINKTRVSSIEAVKLMEQIEKLNCEDTRINSIEPLIKLTKLNELNISNCNISYSNVSNLKYIKTLTKLIAGKNHNITSCDFIRYLDKLVYLDLNDTRISNISNISSIESIEFLNISNTPVTNIDPIKSLLNLRKLDVSGCNISTGVLDHLNGVEISGNKIVIFPDRNLENEIRKLINNYSDPIRERELYGLTKLELDGKHISNLQGLEGAKNLTYLDISNNNVKDISPICKISGLKKLIAHNNKIEDIDNIDTLFELENLDLSKNNISDIAKITSNDLKRLDLSNNRVSNITTLNRFKDLNYLSLHENQIISGKEALKNLVNLTELYLKNSGITDYGVTSSYYDFLEKKDFNLSSDVIVFKYNNNGKLAKAIREHLGKLENTPVWRSEIQNITQLDLKGRDLDNLDGIEQFTNLTYLNLKNNKFNDLNNLSSLKKLVKLDLCGNNRIIDLQPLKDLKSLSFLYLSKINLANIDGIQNLTNLKELDLSNNNINDISKLSKLTDLTKLYLGSNDITDLSYIENLKNLKTLDLVKNNRLDDIYPLRNLTNLISLTLPSSVENYDPVSKYYYNLKYKNFEFNGGSIIVIKDIHDINVEINKGDKFTLPTMVDAVMNNNSKEKFNVIWSDDSIDTLKPGTYTFKGTVENYGREVKLNLIINDDIPNNMGNTPGNLLNKGFAASDGEYIYYVNADSSNRIYKNKIDGTDDGILSNKSGTDLNCYGDYIYFVSNGNICRIKKDGSSESEEEILRCDAASLVVYKDWIYYFDKSRGGIYKFRTDNTGHTNVIDRIYWSLDSNFAIDKNNIYYQNYDDNCSIYKVDFNGSGNVKLNNIKSKNLIVNGNYVYYTSNGNLYKMTTNGTGNTLIHKGNISNINIFNSKIYYININDDNRLYKMNLDGQDAYQITDESIKFINVLDNAVYYVPLKSPDKIRIKEL